MSEVKLELRRPAPEVNQPISEVNRLSNEGLLVQLRKSIAEERKLTLQILNLINEAARRRLYAELGYPSLFEWLVKDLGYSESAAMRRINSARALTIDQSIGEKVKSGELNITNLSRAQSVIRAEERRTGEALTSEAKLKVVDLVTAKSSREAEVALASRFPEAQPKKESVRPVSSEEYRVQVTLTQAQLKKLERVREVASHTHCGASLAEVIELLADQYLRQKDPLKRQVKPRGVGAGAFSVAIPTDAPADARATDAPADATQVAHADSSTAGGGSELNERHHSELDRKRGAHLKRRPLFKRRPIKPSLRNLVFRRAQGQCEYVDTKTNRRCQSGYLAEIDHRRPVAMGGGNEPENLRLMCRAHNALMAKRLLGLEF